MEHAGERHDPTTRHTRGGSDRRGQLSAGGPRPPRRRRLGHRRPRAPVTCPRHPAAGRPCAPPAANPGRPPLRSDLAGRTSARAPGCRRRDRPPHPSPPALRRVEVEALLPGRVSCPGSGQPRRAWRRHGGRWRPPPGPHHRHALAYARARTYAGGPRRSKWSGACGRPRAPVPGPMPADRGARSHGARAVDLARRVSSKTVPVGLPGTGLRRALWTGRVPRRQAPRRRRPGNPCAGGRAHRAAPPRRRHRAAARRGPPRRLPPRERRRAPGHPVGDAHAGSRGGAARSVARRGYFASASARCTTFLNRPSGCAPPIR
jgi:hypothetical protein